MFEIGNSLREARLRQGLDLPQVEHATKIRGKYLLALEDEHFEVLPAETYVRGFLRTYADALGLDGQLYVDEFNSRYVVEAEEPMRPRRSQQGRQHRRVESNVVLLTLLGIAIVTALVIAAWKFGGGEGSNVIPTVGGSTVTTPKIPARPAALSIRAVRGSSLLEVRAGSSRGRPLFAGTLEQGQVQRFYRRRLWIAISTPKNVRVVVGGKTLLVRRGRPLVGIVVNHRLVAAR